MKGFVLRFVVTGVAVLVASHIVPGLVIDSLAAGTVAVLVLAILNALLRPILYVLSAPFIVVTLGVFTIVINAFLLSVVSVLVKGFHVNGLWSAAGGAMLISLVSVMMNVMVSDRSRVEVAASRSRTRRVRHLN